MDIRRRYEARRYRALLYTYSRIVVWALNAGLTLTLMIISGENVFRWMELVCYIGLCFIYIDKACEINESKELSETSESDDD